MDTRLAILSGAAFAGVLLGGLLVADPGVADSVNPARVAGGLFDSGDSQDQDSRPGDSNGDSQATFENERGDDGEDDDDRFEGEDGDRFATDDSSRTSWERADEGEDD